MLSSLFVLSTGISASQQLDPPPSSSAVSLLYSEVACLSAPPSQLSSSVPVAEQEGEGQTLKVEVEADPEEEVERSFLEVEEV